ncbi:hypothetical protein V6N13_005346 [Hibiscus sabdariffa]|uniref:Uncharacterized protein n=1 Tax=Hibiscus sabdariffa TaxID=183260 RepID=A0ABR2EQY5_9ROSI
MNKKVYKLGKAGHESHSAMTDYDSETGLFADQRVLCWAKETCCDTEVITSASNIKGCPGEDQAQVHRYIFKVWTWSFLDNTGKGQVLWQAQGLNITMFFHEVISSYLCQTHLLQDT